MAASTENSPAAVRGKGIFPPEYSYGDDELLVPEVFQGHLPTTLEKSAVRLAVNPHLGDVQNKERLRMTTSLRYGLTENWETSMAGDLYFSHGHGVIRSFDSKGVSTLRFGMKVNLGEPLLAGWKMGAGADYIFPNGRPPAELTDGLRHFIPYVTVSHRLESHPDLRIFFGFRYEDITHTSVPGEFADNAFHDSSTGITGGWVLDRKNWHYTFETSYDTTRLLRGPAKDVYTARPGVIWEIPSRRHPQTKSNWVVGVALNGTFGRPGSISLGASFRLRYSRDIKDLFRPTSTAPAR